MEAVGLEQHLEARTRRVERRACCAAGDADVQKQRQGKGEYVWGQLVNEFGRRAKPHHIFYRLTLIKFPLQAEHCTRGLEG